MELNEKMENLGSQIKNDLEKSNTELKNEIKGLQDQFDQLTASNVDLITKGLTFADELKSQLSSTNPELLAKGFKYDLKAAAVKPQADMSPEYRAGVTNYANRKVNARQLFAVGSTSSDAVKFVEETGYTNNAGIKLEGVASGESTFAVEQKTAIVDTIATHLIVSKEMLSDVDGLSSYLANRVPAKLAEKEDQELLFGVSNIKGVSTTALSFLTTTYKVPVALSGSTQEYDVLRVAVNMVAIANYSASAILVHPTDKTKLELAKDSTGNYLFPSGNMSVAGVPIVESTAMTEGKFLVGDFRMGAEIKERQGVTISYWPSDGENAKKGLITITAEERIALPVYHKGAFVSGDFVAAIAKIKS